MSSTPPPGFVDLNTALTRLNADVNIMGVVVDCQAPARSRGTDWMFSFTLADLSYGGYDDGFKVRFFRPMQSEMPAITGTGDVVLLRLIRIKEWSGMTLGLANWRTSWTVFPAASIPTAIPPSQLNLKHVKETRATIPNPSEGQYAVSLCNSRDRSTFTVSNEMPASTYEAGLPSGNSPANAIKRDKFTLVKDAQVETYYDLVGQVVKVYAQNDRVELYVSDYTSNNLLFNYEWGLDDEDVSGREGDEYNYAPRITALKKWNGPPGKLTLTVTLWPPHASFGREKLKENDFVHLRNVHIKWSQDKKMEGVLHSDRRYPDRVDVTILKNNEDDDRVKDLLRRKRAHVKKFQDQSTAMVAQARALKRKKMGDGAPLSKNQARKRNKRQGKEQLANPSEVGDSEDKENLTRSSFGTPKDRDQSVKPQKQDLNPNGTLNALLIFPDGELAWNLRFISYIMLRHCT